MKSALLTTAALGALLTAFVPQAAFADAETEALKKEVKLLEARINQLEKKEAAQPAATEYAPPASSSIAKRVAIVERKQENDEEAVKAAAAASPKVEVGSKGLKVTSPDKQYSLNIHGYVQADSRTFMGQGATGDIGANNTSTFLIRAARPIFDAKITDYFDARLMMDFGKGSTTLLDAYGDFHPLPGSDLISLKAGEFKSPVGLERWQSEQEILFVERGQTTNLVPYRDIGVMAHGQLIPDQIEYELGILNGAADLQANTGDTDNNKDVVARLFTHPLSWTDIRVLKGFGIGAGGTYGIHQGTSSSTGATSGLTAGYVTTGQRTFFTYLPTDFADGQQWRINPQVMYYNGPFSLLGEYVLNNQEIAKGAAVHNLKNQAWEGIATYVLTGEDASFDGVKPFHNFNPKAGDWGAFELAGRISELNVDRKAFPVFADPTVSARSDLETTLGANWYLNPSVKVNLDYSWTAFDGGAIANHDRKDEHVVLARTQLRF